MKNPNKDYGNGLGKGASLDKADPHDLAIFKERFFAKAVKTETGCLEWQGYRDKYGYGMSVAVKGASTRMMRTHRLAYLLTHGEIPHELLVCHKCDNTSCINPAHLFLGTSKENAQDREAKGRGVRGDSHWTHREPGKVKRGDEHYSRTNPDAVQKGSNHGGAKLTEEAVREIRYLRDERNMPFGKIAHRYGISTRQAHDIAKRKSWRHIP
jgi:hypothetical protein